MSYTVVEAAKKLGIDKSNVLRRIQKGILKAKLVTVKRQRWEIEEKSLIKNMESKLKRRR
jgi:hypothetical protein